MKTLFKFLLAVIVIISIIFICLAVFVGVSGRQVAEKKMEDALNINVEIGKISLGFPLSVHLEGLQVGHLLSADKISFSPNLLGLLAGKIVLSGLDIVNPVVNLEMAGDGKLVLPAFKKTGKQPPFFLTDFNIKNGRINFVDKKTVPEGFVVVLDNLNAHAAKVMLPLTSLNTKFDLSADIKDAAGNRLGEAGFGGEIDFGKKDMDAVFALKDLDITYFSPYYVNFISNKKLLSATLNIKSKFEAVNDDLAIDTGLRLSNLRYPPEEPKPEGELPSLNMARNTLDFFTDENGNLNLDFAIKTKLSSPNLTVAQLKQAVLSAAARNIASQNPASIIEKVQKNIEQFKDFGKQMEKIFKNKE